MSFETPDGKNHVDSDLSQVRSEGLPIVEKGLRKQLLSMWALDINWQFYGLENPKVSLDEVKDPIRDGSEQWGVYVDGEFAGDIKTEYMGSKFTQKEFQEKLVNLVKQSTGNKSETNVSKSEGGHELEKSRVNIKIDKNSLSEIVRLGVVVSGDQWTFKNLHVDMYANGANALIKIAKKGEGKFLLTVTEKGGKEIEYDIEGATLNLESRREV